jgi:hypothetical protein
MQIFASFAGWGVLRLVLLVAALALPSVARADTGIPGPLIFAAGSLTVSMWQWILVTMAMCVSVEWAVYRYSRQYRRPLLASAFSNSVSLVAGVPLTLLGAIDPTWFVLPTIASIVIERMAIGWIGRFVLAENITAVRGGPVIWGNVVTNVMLVALLFVANLKSEGRWIFSF